MIPEDGQSVDGVGGWQHVAEKFPAAAQYSSTNGRECR